jgi:hypothetical protein
MLTGGFMSRRRYGRRQDAPLANQVKATRERTPGPYNTCSFSLKLHSSYASDRGGSFGRESDRMHATTDDDRSVPRLTNSVVHKPLSSRVFVHCANLCTLHKDFSKDSLSGGGRCAE